MAIAFYKINNRYQCGIQRIFKINTAKYLAVSDYGCIFTSEATKQKPKVMKKAKEIAQENSHNRTFHMSIDEFRELVKSTSTYQSFLEKLSTRPPLKGTEKQVKWAEEIRNKFIEDKAHEITATSINLHHEGYYHWKTDGMDEDATKKFNTFAANIIKESRDTNAVWWIENYKHIMH